MKTRSGFVSNSSSSSFVFVGFPISEIEHNVSNKEAVLNNISKRDLDRYALSYFSDDKTYNDYQDEIVDDKFWNSAFEHFRGDINHSTPDGYVVRNFFINLDYVDFMGIDVECVGECGVKEFDPRKAYKVLDKIKKDYPTTNPKIMIGNES